LVFTFVFDCVRCLQEELRQYDASLMDRPAMVLLNKMDLPDAAAAFDRVRKSTLLPIVCGRYGRVAVRELGCE
jgi:GTPase involved in cell partitioning and DNA repair